MAAGVQFSPSAARYEPLIGAVHRQRSQICSVAVGMIFSLAGAAGAGVICMQVTRQPRTAPGLRRVFRGRPRERLTIIGAVGARLRELPDLCPKFFDMRGRRGGVLFGDALNNPGSQRRGDDTDQADTGEHQRHGNDAAHAGDGRQVAVPDRRDRGDRPPNRVTECGDLGAGMLDVRSQGSPAMPRRR